MLNISFRRLRCRILVNSFIPFHKISHYAVAFEVWWVCRHLYTTVRYLCECALIRTLSVMTYSICEGWSGGFRKGLEKSPNVLGIESRIYFINVKHNEIWKYSIILNGVKITKMATNFLISEWRRYRARTTTNKADNF